MSRLHEFEEVIGYHFNNQGLLRQALTHSSYANERHMKKHSDNERLEFLGLPGAWSVHLPNNPDTSGIRIHWM